MTANHNNKFALLGATGQCGSAVLDILYHDDPTRNINVFVRSPTKLAHINPTAAADSSRVTIFQAEDVKNNISTLADCITGTRAVFMMVAAATNQPGCSIAQDTATAVVTAIELLKKQGRAPPRRLVMLSSAETEPRLCRDLTWGAYSILFAANSNIYKDLMAAEAYLRQHADLITSTFYKPGGISNDRRVGHELSMDRQQTFISYPDMAAGMVEVGEREDGRWDMQGVSVLPKEVMTITYENVGLLLKGLIVHFFPGLYSWVF